MAKAIAEIGIGALAIGAAFVLPGVGIAISASVMSALIGTGGSLVLAGISDALHRNQGGVAVGTSSPIGPWSYVYGTQKVGGILLYQTENSSQGTSNNKEWHRVFALACHPCAIGSFGTWQLRIDGKPVTMTASGSGFASVSPTQITKNITSISCISGVATIVLASGGISGLDGQTLLVSGVHDNTFNGTWTMTQPNPADNTTFTYVCGGSNRSSSGGTGKTTYPDYSNKIYCEFTTGTTNSTFAGLLASGTQWNSSCIGLGRTLVYVRIGYDSSYFPSSTPQVSFVIEGKNDIYDPRTGTRGFTNNAALCIADFLSIPATQGGFGLNIGTDIPTASLIAAANICDEAVSLAGGGTTARYTCDTTILCNQARGSILQQMMSSCAGRISYQGGTYNIVPGSWVTPTFSLTQKDILSIKGNPNQGIRDLCNAVKGVFVSPENDFQQADFPAYQQDSEHGFVSDLYLNADKGIRLFKDISLPCTSSSATAQRLAKIELMRNRFQGRWTVRCFMSAYQVIALDTIQITYPPFTWVNETFEVLSSRFVVDKSNGVPTLAVELDIALTDSSVYDWTPTEQLTPQGFVQPNNVGNRVCSPPEQVFAYTGTGAVVNGIIVPSTITTGADGRIQNSIYVGWLIPNDQNVVSGGHLEVQYQISGAASWTGLTRVDPSVNYVSIPNVNDGTTYGVQVRAVNSAGYPSDWVGASVTVGNVIGGGHEPIPRRFDGGATSILSAAAQSDGTAVISVANFSSTIGSLTANCIPVPSLLTGLNQSQLYYVYYNDPSFVGGNIVPIATQNTSDFTGVSGDYEIGSIITPNYSVVYEPNTFSDNGTSTTTSPTAAYDNDTTSAAAVVGSWWTTGTFPSFTAHSASGDCVWSGFPSVVTSSSANLNVIAATTNSTSTMASMTVTMLNGSNANVVMSSSATTAKTTYTFPIPIGTNISGISVRGQASAAAGTPPGGGAGVLVVYEISIQ